MHQPAARLVDSRSSWLLATVGVVVLGTAFGAPWMAAVALKDIAAEVGGTRSVPALAASLAWFGAAFGGIGMGWIAERVGVRWTVMFGALMMALGLAVATLGPSWTLYLGYGVFVGLIGLSGINAPLFVYISKFFERRRGSAFALISSGTYIAGALWPPIFERVIAYAGWRHAMLWFAVLEAGVIVPLAAVFLRRAPQQVPVSSTHHAASEPGSVLGWPPNLVFAALCAAIFMCCVPMSMPQSHLVAFCSDLGISKAHGAAMLSVLLGTAFLCRQIWGLIADRVGGLHTVLLGSIIQATTMSAFLFTQDEVGLFTVSAAFGLGFSGMIPATVLAGRELFPPAEAAWRIPALLLCSGCGMATGGWLAGILYDHFGYYGPAFATGIVVNLLNFAIVLMLVARQHLITARAY
ncbi:MAG: MFS transporter [Hyphomicrobiales bacterium]|nr:MFS transporter [Hyphomicrobiales bacterium]MBV8823799.1 MFS transporter [Hyphomicrobiales bacterium]MBV9428475.1 MFS transporter [Bradyrhizobiaceae bacterium]